jgi:hypothetical protein
MHLLPPPHDEREKDVRPKSLSFHFFFWPTLFLLYVFSTYIGEAACLLVFPKGVFRLPKVPSPFSGLAFSMPSMQRRARNKNSPQPSRQRSIATQLRLFTLYILDPLTCVSPSTKSKGRWLGKGYYIPKAVNLIPRLFEEKKEAAAVAPAGKNNK